MIKINTYFDKLNKLSNKKNRKSKKDENSNVLIE